MPRPQLPPRLLYDKKTGSWKLKDGARCVERRIPGARGAGDRSIAEQALADYLVSLRESEPHAPQAPADVPVSLVLASYLKGLGPDVAAPERQAYAAKALLPFFGSRSCAELSERLCRDYAASRPSMSTARRELSMLRAALRRAAMTGLLDRVPVLWLPPPSKPRPDWLTRDEFARLLWELYRNRKSRHAARLALAQFYTGSRPRTVAKTTWHERADGPWVDLERGIWYRRGSSELETNKQRRDHGIPDRLLSHLRRWKRVYGGTYISEHPRSPGMPVLDIGKALATASDRAGLDIPVTPHTLKHTSITLAIQSGMTAEDATSYFSTSLATIMKTYWHHSPYYHARALSHIARLGRS